MHKAPQVRRELSVQMRARRLAAGMTISQVAEALEWSETKISNVETGRTKHPAVSDIGLMLGLYGVTGPERDAILDLARKSRRRDWWADYDDVLTGAYASLESGASSVRSYEPAYIPGLLQTTDYMAAISQATLIRDPAAIDRMVEARTKRQEILERPDAPDVWAIIGQHALELLIAHDRELAHHQIEHLLNMADRPNITIQVLPTSAGFHPGMGGAFTILGYASSSEGIVFIEADVDGLYLVKDEELERYRKYHDRLVAKALDPDDVSGYLRGLIT
ncbi:helix-turn-helix domain-containing protein [Thermobifida alba]|uniref:DNA-binding protein n=2 Tax=Thermobifida TaxID=83677 RepID=A0A147KDS8_THECS|nr:MULTISPECIES: helix-turn-helix transcriptional regulator [Thermobifida]KUP95444.1 DNA-binding protein [Thermobifida cellulosilytica TB100]UPT22563.1 helix-turn-helix domain-containing protein [Thermobifida alba]